MEKILNIKTMSEEEFNDFGKEVLEIVKNDKFFYKYILDIGFEDIDILNFPSKFKRAFDSYVLNKKNPTYLKRKKNVNSKFMDVVYKDSDGRPELKSIEYDGYKEIVNYSLNFIYNENIDISKYFHVDFSSILKKETKDYLEESIKNDKWIFIKGSKESLNDTCAFAVINNLLEKKKSKIALIDASLTFKTLYVDFKSDKESFDSFLELIEDANILYIKNFGKDIPSKIIRDEFLIKVLEKFSYSENKVIIFSTDLSLNKVCTKYIFKDETMLQAKVLFDLISNNLLNKKEIEYINI